MRLRLRRWLAEYAADVISYVAHRIHQTDQERLTDRLSDDLVAAGYEPAPIQRHIPASWREWRNATQDERRARDFYP